MPTLFKLPYSRTINVTMARNDNFPTRAGFGIPILLTSETVAGVLDATNLTFSASSPLDISAAGFSTAGDFYQASVQAFAQQPRPVQVKAGWYNSTTAIDGPSMQAALDTLFSADDEWYWLCIEAALRDQLPELGGLIAWVESRNRIAGLDSNNPLHESAADTTNISAVHKDTVDRTFVFYSQNVAEYNAFALAALLGTFNFDDEDTAYTAKYKRLRLTTPANIDVNDHKAITGFVGDGQTGQSATTGHLANVYINIHGAHFVSEGSVLSTDTFIDEIHASDWIVKRTEEEMLRILTTNKRVAMDQRGMEQLASGPRVIMRLANRAGLIARDFDPVENEPSPSVIVTVPDVLAVTAGQRNARLAPAIVVNFRYAGAVHYTTVNYYMNF